MASPKLVIEAIKRRCAAQPPRVAGYEKALLTTVSEILSKEREHRVSPTNVQQKVQDQIDVLGDQIWRRSEGSA
jgi:hypothetical protein